MLVLHCLTLAWPVLLKMLLSCLEQSFRTFLDSKGGACMQGFPPVRTIRPLGATKTDTEEWEWRETP